MCALHFMQMSYKNTMKSGSKKFFYLVGVIILFIVLLNTPVSNDDCWFGDVLARGENPIEWLKWRYETWSARTILEFFLIYVTYLSRWVWAIFTTLFVSLLIWSIYQICAGDAVSALNICALFICIPIACICGAGWIATAVNYTWPISCIMFCIVLMIKDVRNEKIGKVAYCMAGIAAIIGANIEQGCIILLGGSVAYLIYAIINKKSKVYGITLIAISCISLVYILTAPGNANRSGSEIITWFPNFSSLNFMNKVELGITSTFKEFLVEPNFIFIMFCAVMVCCIATRYKDLFYTTVASVPLVIQIACGIFYDVLRELFPQITLFIEPFYNEYGTITILNAEKVGSYIPFLICIIVIVCILVSVFLIFKGNTYSMIIVTLSLCIGFATRVIMGFSPTVWGSGERTYLCMYIAIIVCLCILLKECRKYCRKGHDVFTTIIICGAGVSLIGNLMYIL